MVVSFNGENDTEEERLPMIFNFFYDRNSQELTRRGFGHEMLKTTCLFMYVVSVLERN